MKKILISFCPFNFFECLTKGKNYRKNKNPKRKVIDCKGSYSLQYHFQKYTYIFENDIKLV
jgi:hypothetical protein